jgi:polygalacturonase
MGIFHRITISKCDITKTYKLGISLYTGDGGDLHQVVIRDINMNGVAAPISIRRSSGMHTFHEGNKPSQTPRFFHNVTIRNVNAKNIGIIGILINGISN